MITYFEKQLEIISDSFQHLPVEDFKRLIDRCVYAINKGGKIIASGLGKNVPICEKFVGMMDSLGLNSRFLHTNNAIHGDLGMVSEKDLVLMLSKSGNTDESVILANYLSDRGAELWLLTFQKNSRLDSMFQNKILMHLENEGDLWDIVPNNSTVIYLILLQGLAMQIAESMNIQLHSFKINHPGGGIGEKLKGVK